MWWINCQKKIEITENQTQNSRKFRRTLSHVRHSFPPIGAVVQSGNAHVFDQLHQIGEFELLSDIPHGFSQVASEILPAWCALIKRAVKQWNVLHWTMWGFRQEVFGVFGKRFYPSAVCLKMDDSAIKAYSEDPRESSPPFRGTPTPPDFFCNFFWDDHHKMTENDKKNWLGKGQQVRKWLQITQYDKN